MIETCWNCVCGTCQMKHIFYLSVVCIFSFGGRYIQKKKKTRKFIGHHLYYILSGSKDLRKSKKKKKWTPTNSLIEITSSLRTLIRVIATRAIFSLILCCANFVSEIQVKSGYQPTYLFFRPISSVAHRPRNASFHHKRDAHNIIIVRTFEMW